MRTCPAVFTTMDKLEAKEQDDLMCVNLAGKLEPRVEEQFKSKKLPEKHIKRE